MDSADYSGPISITGPDNEPCALWTHGRDHPWTPSGWEVLHCDGLDTGSNACILPLQALLESNAIVLRGSMDAVVRVLARISGVIDCANLTPSAKQHLLGRCVLRIHRARTTDVAIRELPCTYWPGVYSSMMTGSYQSPTYIPAHLVWSFYAGVFGRFEITTGPWLRSRFSDHVVTYVEPLLGLCLEIAPTVFVPDPAVLDLLLGAYLSPGSPAVADFRHSVLEPCTGSGVLGMTLARLGAPSVTSTDIDLRSVECARRNIEMAGLTDDVRVLITDGLPPPRGERVLLTNPPWHDRAITGTVPDYYRRCLMDPNRRLLSRILRDAWMRDIVVAYVFLGTRSPFANQPQHLNADAAFSGWQTAERWDSPHGIRLYRLLRTDTFDVRATGPRHD